MSKKIIPQMDVKLLWGKSGGMCAICKEQVVEKNSDNGNYILGEMAHIEGENIGSARYNHEMSDGIRNSYKNLILLCPTCHKRIDKNTSDFSVDKLKAVKEKHEIWVFNTLKKSIIQINFSELDDVCKYIESNPISICEEIIVIPPNEKIIKNNLSPSIGTLITMGMLQSKLVKDYLNRHPDIEFSDRLKAGFVEKYRELVAEGFNGDGLFYEMFNFATKNSHEFGTRAAGLAVLTYFFEICEVFER